MSELKTTPEVCGMGHSMKRKEDARFLRGQGKYTDDVVLPECFTWTLFAVPMLTPKSKASIPMRPWPFLGPCGDYRGCS